MDLQEKEADKDEKHIRELKRELENVRFLLTLDLKQVRSYIISIQLILSYIKRKLSVGKNSNLFVRETKLMHYRFSQNLRIAEEKSCKLLE